MGKDKIDKLKGRDNYDEWKLAAKWQLQIKGFWPCIEGTDTDQAKNMIAIATIGSMLESSCYACILDCETGKAAWNALAKMYDDNGTLRRMDLLKYLIRLELNDCDSMEDYINKMMTTHQKLTKSGTVIADGLVAQIMLAGLPDQYRPMVMAIANCGKDLTTDFVKTNLVQEVKHEKPNGESSALVVKNAKHKEQQQHQRKKTPNVTCFECNERGHYARNCPKKTKSKPNLLLASTSLVAKTENTSEWYIDSGASAHMTMCENNFSDLREPKSKEIVVADNARLNVKCAGDINMALPSNGESNNVVVKNVLCIPEICANLMSVSQMAKNGKTLVFDKTSCRIFDENSDLLATAPLVNDLYKLNCTASENASAFVAKTVEKNLWHRRMGHSCSENLRKVKAATDGIEAIAIEYDQCAVCVEGKQTRAPFKEKGVRANGLLDLVHSDVLLN